MRRESLALGLTVLNLLLLGGILLGRVDPVAARQGSSGVLRAGGLEIVDAQQRVRASLTVQPAATVAGVRYPETVLLRLIDPTSGPVVKLTAAANGTALALSDDKDGGLQLFARDSGSFDRVTEPSGRSQTIRP